jgi:DNA-binding MurR/RpiR family transcriptional regulator
MDPLHEPARLAELAADPFAERLRECGPGLSPGARRVLRFIGDNRAIALRASAAELAERVGTSDATVVRAIQAMGFAGMSDLKRTLADTLAVNPVTSAEAMRRTLVELAQDAGQAVDIALDVQREAVDALTGSEARATLRAAVAALHPARRILIFGLGPSAALAGYVATMLERAGRSARALNASGLALADQLLDLGPGDAMIILAYGRAYREVVAVFGEAKRLNLSIVLVTDSLDRSLAKQANVVVPARRGRARRVALHGATLVALEALVLGLASLDGERALTSLDRLNDLRAVITGGRQDVG